MWNLDYVTLMQYKRQKIEGCKNQKCDLKENILCKVSLCCWSFDAVHCVQQTDGKVQNDPDTVWPRNKCQKKTVGLKRDQAKYSCFMSTQ